MSTPNPSDASTRRRWPGGPHETRAAADPARAKRPGLSVPQLIEMICIEVTAARRSGKYPAGYETGLLSALGYALGVNLPAAEAYVARWNTPAAREPEGRTRASGRPRVVCLCGSTRFRAAMTAVNRDETLAGRIVVAPGVFAHDGDQVTAEQKAALDELHRHKIDLADEVVVVCPDGYLGDSTRAEIRYARAGGKPVRYRTEVPAGLGRDHVDAV